MPSMKVKKQLKNKINQKNQIKSLFPINKVKDYMINNQRHPLINNLKNLMKRKIMLRVKKQNKFHFQISTKKMQISIINSIIVKTF